MVRIGRNGNAYDTGTELECCVLGIIRQKQPCTAYDVRRELQLSQSSFWSGSAGSVYPLLERLAARKWVAAEAQPWGDGEKNVYRLTAAGGRVLKQWVRELPPWSGSVTVDPIRTRVFFFDLLTPPQRLAFLDDAEEKTKASLARAHEAEAALRRAGDRFGALGYGGAAKELQSRLSWIASVRRSLATPERRRPAG